MEVLESGDFPYIIINKQRLINFSSNNYLALNGHPYIKEKMREAMEKYGTSSSASRLISGNINIFEEAEEIISNFKNKEACLIFNSGYQANVSIISTLVGEGDIIFSDELNHASIIDGCRLSKAKVYIYRHNDINHLEEGLKKYEGRRRLIISDGVFSMDGDIVKLPEIAYLAEKYDSMVIIDDAHATGVLGEKGGGTEEYFGINKEFITILGTGGKALGVGGAFFCCPKYIREYLINKGRGFIYSTALPPAIPAGLIGAIELLAKEKERKDNLKKISQYLFSSLKEKNLPAPAFPSHITPIIIGESNKTLEIERELRKKGIFAKGIRPPTVPPGSGRIRVSLTAEHKKEDIDRLIQILSEIKI